MNTFQKIMVTLVGIIAIAACVGAAGLLRPEAKPTREQLLTDACTAHPAECEKMHNVHALTERAAAEMSRFGPSAGNQQIANLRGLQDQYDERFIKEGYYGDKR